MKLEFHGADQNVTGSCHLFKAEVIAVLIASMGWFVTAIPWEYIGLIWAYCLFWVFIEDSLKLMVYRHFEQPISSSIISVIK